MDLHFAKRLTHALNQDPMLKPTDEKPVTIEVTVGSERFWIEHHEEPGRRYWAFRWDWKRRHHQVAFGLTTLE